MSARWFRVAWPLGLLLACMGGVRNLSTWTRPAVRMVDCEHVDRHDLPVLEQCVALHPESVELLLDVGLAYEGTAAWERADAAYRRALTIDPQDGDVRVRLGELLLMRGDLQGARGEAALALAVQPGRPAVLDLLRRVSSSSSPLSSGPAGVAPAR